MTKEETLMDIFSNRPLFSSCMLFLAWSATGCFLSGNIKLIIILIAILTLIFMSILAVLRYHSSGKKNIFLLLILCLLSTVLSLGISYSFFDRNYDKFASEYGNENNIQGIVSDVLYESNYASAYQLTVEVLNGDKDEYKAVLECEYPAALKIGDRVSVKAVATKPESNSGRFYEHLSYLSDGIFIIYSSSDETELSIISDSNNVGLISFFVSLNKKISALLTETIGGDEGDLSSALLLGNKNLLSDSIIRDFRRVGASHFLALSGMHMSLIMGAFMMLLKLFIRNSTPIAVIASFIAIFYLALTGFSVSATRSVIMLLIVYLSMIFSGVPDSLTSLSIAATVILIISPGSVYDAGFWMSFASTFGILTFVTPINQYFSERLSTYDNKFKFTCHKVLYSFITAIATSFAAILPLTIVMCIFIKELSVFSVFSSIILSIPTAVIIVLSLILLPLCHVPYISSAIVYAIRIVSGLMIGYCSDFSEYENIVISLNYPFAAAMAIVLTAALLFSCLSKGINPFLSLIPLAVCIAISIGAIFIYEKTNDDKLNVSYINVSSNSDIIVLSSERQAIICDVSNGSLTSYEYALDKISESRATEIKAIMLTRYTNQHNATMYRLFQRNKVREVWIPYPQNSEECYMMETLFGFAKDNNVSVYIYESDETMRAFEHAYIEHENTYIERSAVPIDLINIYTGSEHLTYTSPAFIESELSEKAKYSFSRSQYVIFGSRGPKPKSLFELGGDLRKTEVVTFSDENNVGYFSRPEYSFIAFYLVPKGSRMEFYLAE